ncbi:MAG: type III-B CRISPR module RAMP protein Cmr4 [Cyanothece sp. SIO2G6]|nr:type III-B CRISPR module RAMP protein Cmr4 [Cyanothece sp. SIO2G6]
MNSNISYLYLLAPLHTGGASQEGNTVGIAREVHTELPHLPSSTIRGRLRSSTPDDEDNRVGCQQVRLWGNTIDDVNQGIFDNLIPGSLWIGNGEILWFPISSLSHGVVWITSPFLLRRWLRLQPFGDGNALDIPEPGQFSGGNRESLYLKDAIFQPNELTQWDNWKDYLPSGSPEVKTITQALVLSDANCQILIQMGLWRQVRINLGEGKTLAENAGFRYEEAIPPETLMYFPWGPTTSCNGSANSACQELITILDQQDTWQFGGQESLGRGLVEVWTPPLT